MIEILQSVAGLIVVIGTVIIIIGLIGVFRMPDFFTRLHAASVVDTMGTMLISVGLMLYAGLNLISIKLLLIMMFILITTPAAAHALAKSALHGNLRPLLDEDKQ